MTYKEFLLALADVLEHARTVLDEREAVYLCHVLHTGPAEEYRPRRPDLQVETRFKSLHGPIPDAYRDRLMVPINAALAKCDPMDDNGITGELARLYPAIAEANPDETYDGYCEAMGIPLRVQWLRDLADLEPA